MFDDIRYYLISPPIKAHAELPVVDNIAGWVDSLVPDLSGDPSTWTPNFMNWNFQNWVRVLDNVYGYHNYDSSTTVNLSGAYTGNATFYYRDDSGSTQLYTGSFSFIPSAINNGYTVFSAPYLQVNASGSGTPSTWYNRGSWDSINLNGGGYRFIFVVNGITNYPGGEGSIYVDGDFIPTYYANGNANTTMQHTAHLNQIGFTTDQTTHNNFPGSAYVPGGTYNYTDFAHAVVEQHNQEYPDATYNPDDIPSFDEVMNEIHPTEPPEPTEPGGGGACGCVPPDYDEILSEGELESILNQETYYLMELDTDLPALSFQLPAATLPPEQITLLTETINASYNFWDGLGLSSFLIAVGVLTAFFRFLQR